MHKTVGNYPTDSKNMRHKKCIDLFANVNITTSRVSYHVNGFIERRGREKKRTRKDWATSIDG